MDVEPSSTPTESGTPNESPWPRIKRLLSRVAVAGIVLTLAEGAFWGSQVCHGDSVTPHYSLFQTVETAAIMIPWMTLATFAASLFGAAGFWPFVVLATVVVIMSLPRFPRLTVKRVFGAIAIAIAGGFVVGYLFLTPYNGPM